MARCKPSHDCATCPSRATTEWRALNDSELAIVDKSKRTRKYEPADTLFIQGEPGAGIHCIQSGLIGLRRVDEDGNSVLLRVCGPGTTVGYRAFLCKGDHRNTAEVLAPSVVCFIEQSKVSKLLDMNPRLGERFLYHAVNDISETEDDYTRRLTRSMRSRFLHIMMVFYRQLGYRDETGSPTLDLPIKRMELADLIGAQPESVSRLISSMRSEGLMQVNDRHVRFCDLEAVLREAGAEI